MLCRFFNILFRQNHNRNTSRDKAASPPMVPPMMTPVDVEPPESLLFTLSDSFPLESLSDLSPAAVLGTEILVGRIPVLVDAGKLGAPESVRRTSSAMEEVVNEPRRPSEIETIVDEMKVVGSLDEDCSAGGAVVVVAPAGRASAVEDACVVWISCSCGCDVVTGTSSSCDDVNMDEKAVEIEVEVEVEKEVDEEVEEEVELLVVVKSVTASIVDSESSSFGAVVISGKRPSAVEAGPSSSRVVVVDSISLAVVLLLRGTAVHFLPSMEVRKAPTGKVDMTCPGKLAVPVREEEGIQIYKFGARLSQSDGGEEEKVEMMGLGRARHQYQMMVMRSEEPRQKQRAEKFDEASFRRAIRKGRMREREEMCDRVQVSGRLMGHLNRHPEDQSKYLLRIEPEIV